MRTQIAFTVIGLALLLTGAVFAAPPTIISPSGGLQAGASVSVRGMAPGATLVNVWTEVRDRSTGERIGSVPGLRDDVAADGSFSVRIATPRISFGERTNDLTYDIHVQSLAGRNEIGEAQVSLGSAEIIGGPRCTPGPGDDTALTEPRADGCTGPNLDVSGKADPSALVAIWTNVYNVDTGRLLHMVPGLRTYADAEGQFHARIATPRISIGSYDPLRYEVHARMELPGQCLPATILDVKYDQNACGAPGAQASR